MRHFELRVDCISFFRCFARGCDLRFVSFVFQYVRTSGSGVRALAALCAEIVEHWSVLAVYFDTHLSSTTSELRLITTMEWQVITVALMRPRFAALRVILSLHYYIFFLGIGRLCSS